MLLQGMLKHYKIGLLVSTLLLLIGIGIISYAYTTTGEIVPKGLDFTGGSQISIGIENLEERASIEEALENIDNVQVTFLTNPPTVLVESKDSLSLEHIESIVSQHAVITDSSFRQLGASLGQQFLKDAYLAIAIAFIAMSLVVFFSFKSPLPSLAVILAGASCIIMTIALMNIFHVELTLATLTAILTLIGFVVDIDILLSTRVLKRRSLGNLNERIISSFKTGITMTGCAVVAMLVLLLVSSSPELDSIALVVLFGLIADIPFAWLQNVGLLKIYCKKKGIV